MPRAAELSTANAGMTRLRRKGKASPATMYDCLNAYITLSGTIKPRPGTRLHRQLPPGTCGLVSYEGRLCVFTSDESLVNDTDDRYTFLLVKHPTNPSLAATECHFSQPFMGYMYAVIEFEDNQMFHFWLESSDVWEPDTIYAEGDAVIPTSANGYRYVAERSGLEYPAWSPNVARQVGENVEPTVSNGFYYQVVAVSGANPASGETEPVWPTEEGARVTESQSVSYQAVPPDTTGGTGTACLPSARSGRTASASSR